MCARFVVAVLLVVGVGCSSKTSGGAGPDAGPGVGGAAGSSLATGGSSGTGTGGASGAVGGSAGQGGVAGASGAGGTQGGQGGAGTPGTGGSSTTGAGGAGAGGSGGGTGVVNCVPEPTLPGAVKSPLYTVTANGTALFVEQLTKYAPEMQVHYAHCSLSGSGTATFAVTLSKTFNSFTVSPKSRNITATKNGNTITFSSGPNYLILQFDTNELLFVLIDAPEVNPPKLGDANVKNIADYDVDNTGATLMTTKIQTAINAASGATQNILFFPPGKYLVGELALKSNMTLYLAAGAILYGLSRTIRRTSIRSAAASTSRGPSTRRSACSRSRTRRSWAAASSTATESPSERRGRISTCSRSRTAPISSSTASSSATRATGAR